MIKNLKQHSSKLKRDFSLLFGDVLFLRNYYGIKILVLSLVIIFSLTGDACAQKQDNNETPVQLIYVEADPLAYINKGYSIHLGYENWGMRFDLTKVKVDFPDSFEDAFYGTKAFDLVTEITGFKVDYIGNRTNWTRGAFVGIDVNAQKLNFTHRTTLESKDLSAFNLGIRTGYKFDLYRGFYVTPWAAIWRNIASEESFESGYDQVTTNKWDWITTLHFGYAVKF